MIQHTEDVLAGELSTPTDHKGRPAIDVMSNRALQEEIAANLRVIVDTVEEISKSPMIASLKSGSNPLMAMFGR